jgi:hypothetical protein
MSNKSKTNQMKNLSFEIAVSADRAGRTICIDRADLKSNVTLGFGGIRIDSAWVGLTQNEAFEVAKALYAAAGRGNLPDPLKKLK